MGFHNRSKQQTESITLNQGRNDKQQSKIGQDMKSEQNKHWLRCKTSLGEGDGGLITNKWPAELKLMMELIGSLHSPASEFNLQLFPGLKG